MLLTSSGSYVFVFLRLIFLVTFLPPPADKPDNLPGCSTADQPGPEHQLDPHQYFPACCAAGQPIQPHVHRQPGTDVPARTDGEKAAWHIYMRKCTCMHMHAQKTTLFYKTYCSIFDFIGLFCRWLSLAITCVCSPGAAEQPRAGG